MKRTVGKISVVMVVILLMASGCVKSPEFESISNKEGMDSWLSNNTASDEGISLREQLQVPESVHWTSDKVNEYTTVAINGTPVVPEGTAVPVWRIRQKSVDSELLEDYAQILFDNEQRRTPGNYTKEFRLQYIESLEACLEAGCTADGTPLDEANFSGYTEMLRQALQNAYEDVDTLEEESEWETNETYDYSFSSDSIVYEGDMPYTYDYEEGGVVGLYNGKEYELHFERDGINSDIHFQMYDIEETAYGCPYQFINYRVQEAGEMVVKQEESTCAYSKEEAISLCQDFLMQLGIENMEVSGEIEELNLVNNNGAEMIELGNEGYLIFFTRAYAGIRDLSLGSRDFISPGGFYGGEMPISIHWYMNNEFHAWVESGHTEEDFQLPQMQETAAFIVTDDGIFYACLMNPMENEMCLAQHVKLLEFDQIQRRAEDQMEILYEDAGTVDKKRNMNATVIELNYAAMQAPDCEGEYIMVPVWDFRSENNVWVTVNAIDGSRFDRDRGL